MKQVYEQQEAEQILKKAVTHPPRANSSSGVSHEQLVAMASELGVDSETVAVAVQEWQGEQEAQRERQTFIARRRQEFWPHLWSYLGTNSFLVALNLLTSPDYFWASWPLLGWGIGLFFHALSALPTRGETFEKEFQTWRKKTRRKKARQQTRSGAKTAKSPGPGLVSVDISQ